MTFESTEDLEAFLESPTPKALKAFRKRHNLSAREMGQRIGIGNYSNWEYEGRGGPKGPTLEKLRKVVLELEGFSFLSLPLDSAFTTKVRNQAIAANKSPEQYMIDLLKAAVGIILIGLLLAMGSNSSETGATTPEPVEDRYEPEPENRFRVVRISRR